MAAAAALDAVEKEAMRRVGRSKDRKLVPEMTLLEPGLWSVLPAVCWGLEQLMEQRQGAAFHLRAPDEPEARAAYEAAHADAVEARRQVLANLAPGLALFGELEGADDDGGGDDDDADQDGEDTGDEASA